MSRRAPSDTFSIGMPVYDTEDNLMGYLGIGLYYNLNYSEGYTGEYNGESIPVECWQICKPTPYCKEGKSVRTYWQRWNCTRTGEEKR